jgi:signal transduction histidine kinase
MIAAYSVARWERRRPPWWGLVLVVVLGLCWVGFDPMDDTATKKLAGLVWLSPWVISWLVGALVRSRAQNAEARHLAREQRAQHAVAEERNRIARELHDVIGHSVSVMTVQASAVRRLMRPDQAKERAALETVEATGREALAEMRRMVGVLRSGDEGPDLAPPPTLDQLGQLVENFRRTGLEVVLDIQGPELALPPGLDLTAYRLVQEGLTNTLRHANATRAEVRVCYEKESLQLSVCDNGRGPVGTAEPGTGLLGMRERVAVYGGALVARAADGGGYELRAQLPLGTS